MKCRKLTLLALPCCLSYAWAFPVPQTWNEFFGFIPLCCRLSVLGDRKDGSGSWANEGQDVYFGILSILYISYFILRYSVIRKITTICYSICINIPLIYFDFRTLLSTSFSYFLHSERIIAFVSRNISAHATATICSPEFINYSDSKFTLF